MKSRVIQDEPEGNDPRPGVSTPPVRAAPADRTRAAIVGMVLAVVLLVAVILVVWF
jgi:hypothetical protein